MRPLLYPLGMLLIALVSTNVSGQPAPTTTDQQPPTSSGSGAPDAGSAKPIPDIKGITVKLGDSRDNVAKAYPAATDIGSGNLSLPSDGVKFFFTAGVLHEIMLEDPYKESVEGIKIGATGDDVVAGHGKPDNITSVFGGSGYMYNYEGGSFLRYDVDEKTKKVTDIIEMLPGPHKPKIK